MREGVLRSFTKFIGKHLCQSISLNKVAGLRTGTLLKKRLWHRCFPVNFAKFLRTHFLQNKPGRLLLLSDGLFHVEDWTEIKPKYHKQVQNDTYSLSFFLIRTFLFNPMSSLLFLCIISAVSIMIWYENSYSASLSFSFF